MQSSKEIELPRMPYSISYSEDKEIILSEFFTRDQVCQHLHTLLESHIMTPNITFEEIATKISHFSIKIENDRVVVFDDRVAYTIRGFSGSLIKVTSHVIPAMFADIIESFSVRSILHKFSIREILLKKNYIYEYFKKC